MSVVVENFQEMKLNAVLLILLKAFLSFEFSIVFVQGWTHFNHDISRDDVESGRNKEMRENIKISFPLLELSLCFFR